MKKLLLIIAILLCAQQNFAQCDYADYSDAPDEHYLQRLKDGESGFRYGNPYTMFNRRDYPNWTLSGALQQIRKNIMAGTPIEKSSLPDYAKLYKGIWDSANIFEPNNCSYDHFTIQKRTPQEFNFIFA